MTTPQNNEEHQYTVEPHNEEVEKEFLRRTKLLAKPKALVQSIKTEDITVFSIKQQRFGIHTRYVQAVSQVSKIVSMPGTPDFLAGLCNFKGKLYPVVKLDLLLGQPVFFESLGPFSILLLGENQIELALCVTDVEGQKETVSEQQLFVKNDDQSDNKLVNMLVSDGNLHIALLDAEALLSDKRLFFSI